MKHSAEALRVALALLVVALFGAPAFAQAVPPRELQDILVKTSLMTFNDANTTHRAPHHAYRDIVHN